MTRLKCAQSIAIPSGLRLFRSDLDEPSGSTNRIAKDSDERTDGGKFTVATRQHNGKRGIGFHDGPHPQYTFETIRPKAALASSDETLIKPGCRTPSTRAARLEDPDVDRE
jgi:hypothetical protein